MSGLDKCPECGKLIALRFPMHDCTPKRKTTGARAHAKGCQRNEKHKGACHLTPETQCEDCFEAAEVWVSATTLDGELLDRMKLCRRCAARTDFTLGKSPKVKS